MLVFDFEQKLQKDDENDPPNLILDHDIKYETYALLGEQYVADIYGFENELNKEEWE